MDARDRYEGGSKGVSVLGIISLVVGIIGALISLIPCVGVISLPVTGLGLLLGLIGLIVSLVGKQSGVGLPIAGSVVSLVGLLIGGLWLTLFGVAATDAQRQIQVQQEQAAAQNQAILAGPAEKVSAGKLYDDYDVNEVKADARYKDKVLEITGEVQRVKDELSKMAVKLKTKEDNEPVSCGFKREHKAELEKLGPGQKVTIRGKCKGKDTDVGEILLENCILVP